jgi:hypothetical protein
MSYDDIGEVRATRAAKYVLKGKEKRGRKRKSVVQEPERSQSGARSGVCCEPLRETGGVGGVVKVLCKEDVSEPEQEVPSTIEATGSWRASVARMY